MNSGRTLGCYPAEGKERLTVRFDEDMVQWFRSQGRGYQIKDERGTALIL